MRSRVTSEGTGISMQDKSHANVLNTVKCMRPCEGRRRGQDVSTELRCFNAELLNPKESDLQIISLVTFGYILQDVSLWWMV